MSMPIDGPDWTNVIAWQSGRGFGASYSALSKGSPSLRPSTSTGRRAIWQLITRHNVSSKAPRLELLWVIPDGSEEAEVERRYQWQGSRGYEWNSQLKRTHTIRKSFPAILELHQTVNGLLNYDLHEGRLIGDGVLRCHAQVDYKHPSWNSRVSNTFRASLPLTVQS